MPRAFSARRAGVCVLAPVSLSLCILINSCGGSSPPIGVAVTSVPSTVDPSDATTLTATVTNDKKNAGVTWKVSGGGTLTNTSTTAATYNAPAGGASALSVTVTATSIADATKSATASVTVPAVPSITTSSLPSGTVGVAYSATLAGTGGISPYTWGVVSGTLPAGLSLSASSGAVSGTPTATGVGASNVTFGLTDSGAATALSASAALPITINAAQAIVFTPASLPAGTYNVAYTGSVAATGGAGALTYTVSSGAMPTGLSLSSSGAISGAPAATGAFNFTVKAADAFGDSATMPLSIAVTYPALTVSTTSLNAAVVGTPYTATLAASGGSGAGFTWSLASGSSLPAGLSLSAGGTISGTATTAGSTGFTVKLLDSASNSVQKLLELTVYSASGVNNSMLKGSYAFVGVGWVDGINTGATNRAGVIGSFVADGNGNITSGTEDWNAISGVKTNVSIMGTYNIAANNTGMLVLTSASGTSTMALSLGTFVSSVANGGSFIEYDDTTGIGTAGGVRISGVFAQQTASAFTTASLNGGYAFGGAGETCIKALNGCSAIATAYGPLSIAGMATFSGSGAITGGEEDAAVGSTQYSAVSLSGTYGTPDAGTGRVAATLNASTAIDTNEQAIWPTDFVFYMVNASQFFALSVDSHATHAMIAGTAHQQSTSSFSSSNLSGTFIAWESAPDSNYVGNFGTVLEASSSSAEIAVVTAGSSGLSFTQYSNSNGTYSTQTQSGLTASVAANGRVTLGAGSNSGGPVFYLVGTNAGFGTETTSSGNYPGFLQFVGQQGSSFSTSTLSGNYYLASTLPVPATDAQTGVVAASSGTLAIAGYKSKSSGSLSTQASSSATFTVDSSTGVLTDTTDGLVGVIISPSQFLVLSTTSSNPAVEVLIQ